MPASFHSSLYISSTFVHKLSNLIFNLKHIWSCTNDNIRKTKIVIFFNKATNKAAPVPRRTALPKHTFILIKHQTSYAQQKYTTVFRNKLYCSPIPKISKSFDPYLTYLYYLHQKEMCPHFVFCCSHNVSADVLSGCSGSPRSQPTMPGHMAQWLRY